MLLSLLLAAAVAQDPAKGCVTHAMRKACVKSADAACVAPDTATATLLSDTLQQLDSVEIHYLCDVSALVIDPSFPAAGRAEVSYQNGERLVQITLNPSTLSPDPKTLEAYLSQKLNKAWSGAPNGKAKFDIAIPGLESPFLWYVLTHELAHVIDFEHHLNVQGDCLTDEASGLHFHCRAVKGSFTALSWAYEDSVRQRTPFQLLEANRLAFSHVAKLTDDALPQLLTEIQDSNFATPYGGSNPAEDFAESLTFLIIDRLHPDAQAAISIRGTDAALDLMAHFHGGAMQTKRHWLEEHLAKFAIPEI